MAAGKGEQQVAAAAERLSGLIVASVAQTIEHRSAEPSRVYLSGLLNQAAGDSADEARATELMTTLILVRWVSVAREQLPVDADPDPVTAVLGWIKETLGSRFAARARYTTGPLKGEETAAEMMQYRNALAGDFLPSLVWQLAGIVALYGEGDVAWLRRLVGAPEPES
jgi:hypothetical protein